MYSFTPGIRSMFWGAYIPVGAGGEMIVMLRATKRTMVMNTETATTAITPVVP